jgi:hypothetical protein
MAMGVVHVGQVRVGVPHPAMPVEMGVGLAGRIEDAVLVTSSAAGSATRRCMKRFSA